MAPCGDHLSEPVDVPATGGRWRSDLAGAAFPRLQVAARFDDETQAPGILLGTFDPTGETDQALEVVATPAEALRYAAAIVAAVRLAQSAEGARLRLVM